MKADRTFQKVRDFVARHSMLDGATGVVLAVSGGADSVVMLEMFARLRDFLAKQSHTLPLHVAHLHHGLRGSEADEDAEFVCKIAAEFQADCNIEFADVRAVAELAGKGIEEAAREVRYRFFLDLAQTTGCNRIATGHTMNDQAETFLMRLLRGSGRRGLAAMRPVIAAHTFDVETESSRQKAVGSRQKAEKSSGENVEKAGQKAESDTEVDYLPTAHCLLPTEEPSDVRLVRPLLCLTREEVEAYAGERGLRFRVDASNFSFDYTRNRIRHETMKALEVINPQAVKRLAQTAEQIADEEDALGAIAISLLDEAALPERNSVRAGLSYSVQALLRQPVALRRRVIIEAIRRARAGLSTVSGAQIDASHIQAIADLLNKRSGKRVALPGGIEVWREFDRLLFARSSDLVTGEEDEVLITGQNFAITFGDFELTVRRGQPLDLLQEAIAKNQEGVDWLTVVLDDEKLPDALLVRKRREGERALVVGGRKTKKIKSLMIERKVPASQRQNWPVFSTPEGCYVWSPMLPPEKKFIPCNQTKRLAILSASNKNQPDAEENR